MTNQKVNLLGVNHNSYAVDLSKIIAYEAFSSNLSQSGRVIRLTLENNSVDTRLEDGVIIDKLIPLLEAKFGIPQ